MRAIRPLLPTARPLPILGGVPGLIDRLRHRLFEPVDIASIVVVRFMFGVILVWEVRRYFTYGWIEKYWVKPDVHFQYYGFTWVHPLPPPWIHIVVAALGVLAVMIAVGFLYRAATLLFFIGFSYTFLLEQTRYLTHFDLVSLVSGFLVFIPAHRTFSFDAWLRPGLRCEMAPAWAVWLLRAQIGIPYFYAGIAKLHEDWLLGAPARVFMTEHRDVPWLGPLLNSEPGVWTIAYGGLLVDLLVVPFLLVRRTRVIGFCVAVLFHLLNAAIFNIGMFPWFMIAATTIFFAPDWPRRWRILEPAAAAAPGETPPAPLPPARPGLAGQYVAMGLLATYVAFQCLYPLRHYLYRGNVNWTEEGHRFAWHMILRRKRAKGIFVIAHPPTGKAWTVDPEARMPDWMASKMMTTPDMILQFAHDLAAEKAAGDYPGVTVKARIEASLNGRPPQTFIDPEVNLAAEPRSLRSAAWIVPLTTPLQPHMTLWGLPREEDVE